MLKKTYLSVMASSLVIGASLVLTGCSDKFIGPSDIAETHLNSNTVEYKLSSSSLMQKIMAYESSSKKAATFSPGSSDRFVDSNYNRNPYDAIFKASSSEQKIILKGSMVAKDRDLYIYPIMTEIEKMKITGGFSAKEFVLDKVDVDAIRLRAPKEINSFLEIEATKYDANSNISNRSLYGFMEYLSASAQINTEKLYYGYSYKTKVLEISYDPISLMSSPYRSYVVKKKLDEKRIPYSIASDTRLVIDGTFSDWAKAYSIYEQADPYTAQAYVVSVNGNAFEVQEGYYEDRPVRVEFIGWNDDGTRTYIFYDNKYANQITTSARVVQFSAGEKSYQIRFF